MYSQMKFEGVTPNITTHNILLGGFYMTGSTHKVEEILRK